MYIKTLIDPSVDDLASAKATNGWDRLPYLHIEARTLLDTVLESRLWKEYCKEDSIRQFRDNQYGTRKMYSASKNWVNGQMIKLRDHLVVTRYGELKEEHKHLKKQYEQKSELCDEKQQKIDQQMRELQTQDLKLITLNSQVVAIKEKLENAEKIMMKQENNLSDLKQKQKQDKNKFKEDLEAVSQEKVKLEKKRAKDKEKIKLLKEELAKAEELRLQRERDAEEHKEHSEHKLEPDNTSVIIRGKEQKIKEISKLGFGRNQEEDIELIEQLIPYKMPPLQELKFYFLDIPQNTDILNEFLSDSFCEHIQQFYFHSSFGSLSITPLMASLSKVLPLVSQEVYFRCFCLSQTELEDLLVAAKNVKLVRILGCTIKGDGQVAFGGRLERATFEELKFSRTGFESKGGYEIFFKSIVEALAKVESVKSRQIRIKTDYSDFNKGKAEKILKEYGLTKMELC